MFEKAKRLSTSTLNRIAFSACHPTCWTKPSTVTRTKKKNQEEMKKDENQRQQCLFRGGI